MRDKNFGDDYHALIELIGAESTHLLCLGMQRQRGRFRLSGYQFNCVVRLIGEEKAKKVRSYSGNQPLYLPKLTSLQTLAKNQVIYSMYQSDERLLALSPRKRIVQLAKLFNLSPTNIEKRLRAARGYSD